MLTGVCVFCFFFLPVCVRESVCVVFFLPVCVCERVCVQQAELDVRISITALIIMCQLIIFLFLVTFASPLNVPVLSQYWHIVWVLFHISYLSFLS